MLLKNPVSISVIVLTYNSSQTICATLNSIANQTIDTRTLELIISDDASTDSTIVFVDKWLEENECKFDSVLKIMHPNNLGIVSNLDNAYKRASGEWIKIIAGDDLLTPGCLKIYSNASSQTLGRVFLSYMQTFTEDDGVLSEKKILPPENQVDILSNGNLEKQKKYLTNSSFSATPSLFIQKSLLDEIGYLDKNYFLMEDYPLWIKITNYGERIHFVPEITVYYRVQESVSRSKTRIVNLMFLSDVIKLDKLIINSLSPLSLSSLRRKVWVIIYPKIVYLFNNERNLLSKFVLLIINILFKPKYLLLLLKRKISDS